MVYTIERIPIGNLIVLFVLYIVVHLLIAWKEKGLRQELEDGDNKPDKVKLHKWMNLLNKWFPAVYVIFLLVLFYLA